MSRIAKTPRILHDRKLLFLERRHIYSWLSIHLGEGMNYSIATTESYPGPSSTMSILSGCLWFHNVKSIKETSFFLYDNSSTFEFGYHYSSTLYVTVQNIQHER